MKFKRFYEVIADGKFLGVLLPSKQTEQEVARLKGLCGIEVVDARTQTLIEINAKTQIPKSLFNVWNRAFKKAEKLKAAQDEGKA